MPTLLQATLDYFYYNVFVRFGKYQSLCFALIIFIVFSILYSYRLFISYNFDNDFARDLINIFYITHAHRLTLIGPGASVGIQTGPYYYYLFAPIVLFSNANINAVLFFNAILFSLSLAFYFFQLYKNSTLPRSALATISLGILPVFVISARNPGNAFSYIPFLLLLLTFIMTKSFEGNKGLISLGLLAGIIINFHYANTVVVGVLLLFLILNLKNKITIWFFIIGVSVSFTPLLLFELRHNFVMLTNLLVNKSYVSFTENKQLAGVMSAKKNLFDNLIFMSNNLKNIIGVNPWYFFAIGVLLSLKNRFSKDFFLFLCSFAAFLITTLLLRSQFAPFYLYPVAILLSFSTIILVIKSRYYLLIILFIFMEIISFPYYLYNTSIRPYSKFADSVDYVMNKQIITTDRFNILQVRPDTIIAPYGYEYRFFFVKNKLNPAPVTEYNVSEQLLIFSEIPHLDLKKLNNWEYNQFPKKHNVKRYEFGALPIYSLAN